MEEKSTKNIRPLWKNPIIWIVLAMFLIVIYIFGLRPIMIKSDCYNKTKELGEKHKRGESTEIGKNLDRYYDRCLKKNAL